MDSSWHGVTNHRSVPAVIIKSVDTNRASAHAMSLLNLPDYRLMCELGGGRYLSTCDHIVLFQDPQDGFVMKLYAFALRSPEDVKAALRAPPPAGCRIRTTRKKRGVMSGWLRLDFSSEKLDALRERLNERQSQLIAALTVKTSAIPFQLQAKIQEKLSGEILKPQTGALRASVNVEGPAVEAGIIRGSVGIAQGGPTSGYTRIHTLGHSGAYEIIATKRKALAFMLDGKKTFAKRVSHPAIPARPFVHPTLDENREQIIQELGQAVADVVKE